MTVHHEAYEEHAYIVDVSRDGSVAQALGDTHFHLLELQLRVPNDAKKLIGKSVFVGKKSGYERREVVQKVSRKLPKEELTENARKVANEVISTMVKEAIDESASKLHHLLLSLFNYGPPPLLCRVGLNEIVVRELVNQREYRQTTLKVTRPFANFSDVEWPVAVALQHTRKRGKPNAVGFFLAKTREKQKKRNVTPQQAGSYIAKRIAERIGIELGLSERAEYKKPWLLEFLRTRASSTRK